VAAHDFGECFWVGWVAGCGFSDGGDFAEVVRAEDAGGDDCERSGVGRVKIVEAVDRSQRDVEGCRARRGPTFDVSLRA